VSHTHPPSLFIIITHDSHQTLIVNPCRQTENQKKTLYTPTVKEVKDFKPTSHETWKPCYSNVDELPVQGCRQGSLQGN
jgi:hypothetical protein